MISEAHRPIHIKGIGEIQIGQEFEVDEDYAKELEKTGQIKKIKNNPTKPTKPPVNESKEAN